MSDTYLQYSSKPLKGERLQYAMHVDKIVKEYGGDALTVRQIYYQFVARGLLENTKDRYHWLGKVISDGRMAGLIPWTAVVDRGRNLKGLPYWVSPTEAITEARDKYRLDPWGGQQFRPEVWVEKDALSGVIAPICNKLGVNFFACKGYSSQSAQWEAGQRLARMIQKGQRPIIFHLGDHDPSGIDMTRDNMERLSLFAGVRIVVERLALNLDQVHKYTPPPNYAKPTDSRYRVYCKQFGIEECWELDALEPGVIQKIIKESILNLRDEEIYNQTIQEQHEDVMTFEGIIDNLRQRTGGMRHG